MTVAFIDYDGTILKVQEVERGGDATPPDNVGRPGYVLTGWQPSCENVQSDLSCYAQYGRISYANPRIVTEISRNTTLFAYK